MPFELVLRRLHGIKDRHSMSVILLHKKTISIDFERPLVSSNGELVKLILRQSVCSCDIGNYLQERKDQNMTILHYKILRKPVTAETQYFNTCLSYKTITLSCVIDHAQTVKIANGGRKVRFVLWS